MNKKEQAEMQALIKQAAINRALNWTQPVMPDVSPPRGSGETTGFVFNTHNASISSAWSSSVHHSIGYASSKESRSASQNSRHLYSTKLLALRGLRHEVEKECAAKLACIDAEIAKEQSK